MSDSDPADSDLGDSDLGDLELPDAYRDLRRDLHRHPEPAWCEFYTTSRLIHELEQREIDDLLFGPEIHTADARRNVPDESTLSEWRERAREAGASDAVLDTIGNGFTGAVAVVERGDGPTVALRVDIDALPITEADSDDHHPEAAGFRSTNEGYMHACGHDAHATIGLGVLDRVLDSDFAGTFKLVFQPAEETISGAKPIAESGVLDDVDYFLAPHIGLDHPSGEVVAGIDEFLAVRQFETTFEGESAHAGARPETGDNAVQAMAAAVQNLYGIPRNSAGGTRVNAGRVGGGTASNIVPGDAFIEGEVRGETTELMEYMWDRAESVLAGAATMHDCAVETELLGDAPSAHSDAALVDVVDRVARRTTGVDTVVEHDSLGGSEDATYLMQRVQEHGGLAAYVGVGTDHPGGHHTPTFDVEERDIAVGIDLLAGVVEALTDTAGLS
ncbi:amidohydrolase [Halonotius terrestris]|uniref:Amidohydrolase n=1 Tax=Halonotius terrestris TaxID=2487750 RepID=A0A8J8TCV2_9EURY|nr:amidohydrolase [Halonotius terrestris]TQQ82788.1 amidohydrolase [Halonotius terrestris]